MTTAINAELDAVVGGFSDTLKKMLTPAPKTVGTGLPGLVGGNCCSWFLPSWLKIAKIAKPTGSKRGGPGCLNRFSASISGASARVRLPSGVAAG
jgi:hypothetical protein